MIQNIKHYFNLIGNEIKTSFVENKHLLLFSTLLFIIPMFLGYFFSSYIDHLLDPMVNSFRDRVQSGDIKLNEDSIFFNNVYVAIMLYCGAILFGLITAVLLVTNGAFIGYFATQLPLTSFLLLNIPHGIFEIPAIIIAGCAGFVMLKFLIKLISDIANPKLDYNEGELSVVNKIVNSFNDNIDILVQSLALLGVAVILLVIAAFIEVHATIDIANYFMGSIKL